MSTVDRNLGTLIQEQPTLQITLPKRNQASWASTNNAADSRKYHMGRVSLRT